MPFATRLCSVYLALLVLSCSPAQEQSDSAAVVGEAEPGLLLAPAVDTLAFQAHPRHEIIYVYQRHDTLEVVSESSTVAYPLGQLATPNEFLARYPGFALASEVIDPDSTGPVPIHTFTRGTTRVRLVKLPPDEEAGNNRWMDITSGQLTDPALPLATGVRVGMTQSAVVKTLFASLAQVPARPLRVIALTYAVGGQIQYCRLDKGIVSDIQLVSNYIFR